MNKHYGLISWFLSITVTVLAIVAWGESLGWDYSDLNLYILFPLFGLLAFSLMWAHYAVGFLRQMFKFEPQENYFEITSYAVLFSLLLHPGLLAWQLWRDGMGLPPASELNYVDDSLTGLVLLGMVAWVAFMLYELYRWYKDKPWFKYISYASDAAMLAIVWHSLNLGSHLQFGWYRGVWFFYAFSLVLFLITKYWYQFSSKK